MWERLKPPTPRLPLSLRGERMESKLQSRSSREVEVKERRREPSKLANPNSHMASSSSSSLPSPFFLPRIAPFAFTPISEREEEGQEEEEERRSEVTPSPREQVQAKRSVDRIRCRASKVPVKDFSSGSPSSVLQTLFSSLSCKNSLHPYAISSSSTSSLASARHSDDGISGKPCGGAAKERDEALQEVSRLREMVSEMEKKIARLESYGNDLRSALHRCGGEAGFPASDEFLGTVTESRTMARHLARFVVGHIRQAGRSGLLQRLTNILRPYGVDLSSRRNTSTSTLVLYVEGVLSWVFFEDFESPDFEQSGSDRILDPSTRCESNRKAYRELKGLSWEEVLLKGTKQRSKGLSRFCDGKMRKLMEVMGWGRSWPGSLLHAFFGMAKWVWLLHLSARSVHPMVPLFRVRAGDLFDPGYMEDASGSCTRMGGAASVRVEMMVSPGFYASSGVIKSRVICTS